MMYLVGSVNMDWPDVDEIRWGFPKTRLGRERLPTEFTSKAGDFRR